MPTPVFDHIHIRLKQANIAYDALHHEPTPTSEDAARVRGVPMHIGGKSLVLKIGNVFALFVISAALKLDAKKLEQHFGIKKVRFATTTELFDITGLIPGSVPPFGHPILPLDLYADTSITANDRIAFNAGSVTDSVIMAVPDYLALAQPKAIFSFALFS